jgi:16S rRNA G966 N2-methylase RsmD
LCRFVWLLRGDFDLTFQLLTSYISALSYRSFSPQMASLALPFPQNQAVHRHPHSLAGLPSSTWSFNHFNHQVQGRSNSEAPSAIGRNIEVDNGKSSARNLELSNRSLSSTDRDTEMPDAPKASCPSSSSGLFQIPARQPSFPAAGDPVVYVAEDGGHIEITRSSTRDPDSGVSNIYEGTSPLESGTTTVWPNALGNSSVGASRSRSAPRSRPRFRRQADQGQSQASPYLFSEPSSQEPDVQILDSKITAVFPAFTNSKLCPGDYLDDAAFEKMMSSCAPHSNQEINEDDDAAVEDFAEEEYLVDHLRSLVISLPTENLSNSARKTTWKASVDPDVVKQLNLRKGVTVELQNGSFLWIDSVRENSWRAIALRGYKLVRDGYCGAKLPSGRTNELVWVNEIDEEGHGAGLESVIHEVQVSDVKRARQIFYTNCPWPICSYDESKESGRNRGPPNDAIALEHGKLYCRWKYNEVKSRLKTDAEACLTMLSEKEAIGVGGLEASVVRQVWREDKGPRPGGSSVRSAFDVETGETISFPQYNLGDCFCGAGGISRGATQAGLQVAWGFDDNEEAIKTHAENFSAYGTRSLKLKDGEMIDRIKANPGKYKVDIAHYSPPCQPFSSANHNKNAERDFANQKALFSLHDLTRLLKPRIATIEETAGMMHRHKQWFNALIHIFTNLGYSVRWKIVRCQEHGIPQSRVRLILMAAA